VLKKPDENHEPVLAMDLGGTKLLFGVVTSSGKILEREKLYTDTQHGPDGLIDQMVGQASKILKKHPEIKKIGIASAGPLDTERGVLLNPTNLKGKDKESWGMVPVKSRLEERLKLQVVMENDADAATVAEGWLGKGKDCANFMVLTLGTGLGTGIVVRGEPFRNRDGLHPEAGHMIIDASDRSALCGCGNYGCAEAFLSGVHFNRRMNRKYQRSYEKAQMWGEAAEKNDPEAKEAFRYYGDKLALAIRNFAVMFAPEKVYLTGGFSETSHLFLQHTRSVLAELLKGRRKGVDLMPEIEPSIYGKNAGILGAAYFAFRTKKKS
jgi:glucokinase